SRGRGSRAASFRSGRYQVRHKSTTLIAVDYRDGVVLAVGAGGPEEHREPPPEAQLPLLRERPEEDERAADELVVGALGLGHPVDEDFERRPDVVRQV